MIHHPDCHYGDHHWVGGRCSLCGKPFRCLCGRFLRIEDLDDHIDKCPSLPVPKVYA